MIEPAIIRKPYPEERKGAVALAKELRQVTYPTRARTTMFSQEPPGRIYMKEAMQYAAQIQMKTLVTAKPFMQERLGPATTAPISVGFMGDISGSMGSAQEPLSVSGWMLSEAVHMVNGSVATVLFGQRAYPVLAPHERPKDIRIYQANHGQENYMHGFRLIDAALDLIDGQGARLLVIVSDGHFVLGEAVEWAEITMDMCRKAGVGVVWLPVSSMYFARPDGYGHGEIINAYNKSPVEIATMLGKEVVKQFRKTTHSMQIS